MRLSSLLGLAALVPAALAANPGREHWAETAAKSKNGIIQLDSESYDDILAGERDYGVLVELTALPAQYKCVPCHEFEPVYTELARSWQRAPKDAREKYFIAQLDFHDGQEVYQRLQLSTAPTVFYHPPNVGERKGKDRKQYDLNRAGLGLQNLHSFVKTTTPVSFEIYRPMSPWPFIITPFLLGGGGYLLYASTEIWVPIAQSRIFWGILSIIACTVWTSGYMWNRIKNAPYVTAGQNGEVNWIAQGYGNQYGLETQVVALLYASLAGAVVILTTLIPAQSNSNKQRVGVLLWVALIVVLYSFLIRLFKIKNGGYPFGLF